MDSLIAETAERRSTGTAPPVLMMAGQKGKAMKYIHETDYKALWRQLEDQLKQNADDFDWEGATADDADQQKDAYSKKEMCYQILDLMDSLRRHAK